MKKLLTAICLTATLLYAGIASATTATGTFDVTATVTGTCITSGTNLAFGAYSGIQIDNTSTLTVTCTNGTSINKITLDLGMNYINPNRKMKHGASDYLNYGLYSDSGRTTVWDLASYPTPPAMDGTAKNITVYGRLPGAQLGAPVGSYTDTITITVDY